MNDAGGKPTSSEKRGLFGSKKGLRDSLCKILISSFAHKMDFVRIFSVDFF